MIEVKDLEKSFGSFKALGGISLNIRNGQVFGLIGTNGAGKSTLLRIVSGVMREDKGSVTIDGRTVFDRPETKKDLFFIADDPYFFPNSRAADMAGFYASVYPSFDTARFGKLLGDFGLDPKRRINTYSKGMKKQLAILLGLSARTTYLLCDETFDGLDPVMRQGIKALFAREMLDRGLTPVIASHNLRELEDICDHIGLLHKGGVLLSEDLETMKIGIQKIQCVPKNEADLQAALEGLEVLSLARTGRLAVITVRAERQEILRRFGGVDMQFFEVLPLTLEEVFISETEAVGYDIKKLILD